MCIDPSCSEERSINPRHLSLVPRSQSKPCHPCPSRLFSVFGFKTVPSLIRCYLHWACFNNHPSPEKRKKKVDEDESQVDVTWSDSSLQPFPQPILNIDEPGQATTDTQHNNNTQAVEEDEGEQLRVLEQQEKERHEKRLEEIRAARFVRDHTDSMGRFTTHPERGRSSHLFHVPYVDTRHPVDLTSDVSESTQITRINIFERVTTYTHLINTHTSLRSFIHRSICVLYCLCVGYADVVW